ERVDGKEWIALKPGDPMPADEALHFKPLVLGFVSDSLEALGRRTIVGQLEDATEQDRHVVELYAGARLDFPNAQMAQVRVETSEVEMELNLDHNLTILAKRFPLEAPRISWLQIRLPIRSASRCLGDEPYSLPGRS